MSQTTRNDYLEKMRDRYRRYTGKQARSKLITEFCEVTGHERKYGSSCCADSEDRDASRR